MNTKQISNPLQSGNCVFCRHFDDLKKPIDVLHIQNKTKGIDDGCPFLSILKVPDKESRVIIGFNKIDK
jgi:hypothetical protein